MLIVASIGVFGISLFLDSYTQHDEFVEVPDFEGYHFTEVGDYISDKNLRFEISDSIFDVEQPRGVVLEQLPLAGEMVKPGRKVYLTINSVIPPHILLPELRDYTVRQVVMKIETYGLKIDSLIYKPAECDNCVIGVLYKGEEVEAGTRITKGKSISLIVGEGIGSEKVAIPFLYELSYQGARDKLNALGLNQGFVDYDTSVVTGEDSLNAFVFSQTPSHDTLRQVRKGQAFDLILTLDSNKLEGIQLPVSDTTIVEEENDDE